MTDSGFNFRVSKATKHLSVCRESYLQGKGKSDKDPIKVCKWQMRHHVKASVLVEHERMCEDNCEHIYSMLQQGIFS